MDYFYSPKIDWLQYSVLKIRQNSDDLSSIEVHKLDLCDLLLGSLFCNVDRQNDSIILPLINKFIDTFVFKELRFKVRSASEVSLSRIYIPGYQFCIGVSDKFKIFVPLRRRLESDPDSIFSLIRGRSTVVSDGELYSDWFVYNEFIGLSICFSGSQLSRDLVHLSFDDFMTIQKKLNLDFKIQRLDLALDSTVDFSVVYNKLINNRGIRPVNIDPKSIRFDVNLNDNSGSIIAGKRGSSRYMRIYNKFAEQNGSAEFYPFFPYWKTIRSLNDMRNVECFPWTRLEFELRDKAALECLFMYLDCSVNSTLFDYFTDHFKLYSVTTDSALNCVLKYQWTRLSFDGDYAFFLSQNSNFVQLEEVTGHKDFSVAALSNKVYRSHNAYKVARCDLYTLYSMAMDLGIDFNKFAQTGGTVANIPKAYKHMLTNIKPGMFMGSLDDKLLSELNKFSKNVSEYSYQLLTSKGISTHFESCVNLFVDNLLDHPESNPELLYSSDKSKTLFDKWDSDYSDDQALYHRFKSFVSDIHGKE